MPESTEQQFQTCPRCGVLIALRNRICDEPHGSEQDQRTDAEWRSKEYPPTAFEQQLVVRSEILALVDHYIREWPDDAQVLGYLRDAIEIGMERHALTESNDSRSDEDCGKCLISASFHCEDHPAPEHGLSYRDRCAVCGYPPGDEHNEGLIVERHDYVAPEERLSDNGHLHGCPAGKSPLAKCWCPQVEGLEWPEDGLSPQHEHDDLTRAAKRFDLNMTEDDLAT